MTTDNDNTYFDADEKVINVLDDLWCWLETWDGDVFDADDDDRGDSRQQGFFDALALAITALKDTDLSLKDRA